MTFFRVSKVLFSSNTFLAALSCQQLFLHRLQRPGPNKAASRSRKKLGFETNDCRNAFTFQKCQDAPVVVLQSSPLHPLKNLRCIDLSFLHFSDLHWQHFGGCESLQRASHLRPGKTTLHYYYPFVHDQSYL